LGASLLALTFDDIADETFLPINHGLSTPSNSAQELSDLVFKLLKQEAPGDPEDCLRMVQLASSSKTDREPLLALKGDEAQRMLGILQEVRVWYFSLMKHVMSNEGEKWLDSSTLPCDDSTRRKGIYLLVKLAACSYQLPSTLFLHDVELGESRDPEKNGGSADVFRARRGGEQVAIKRMRGLSDRDKKLLFPVSSSFREI
jgi:hypothetical protein